MAGGNFSISCPKCGVLNTLRGKAMTRALTCQACHTYFRTDEWNKATVEFANDEPQALPIGAKGNFEGYIYEIIGFAIKQESQYHYRWREYLIFNPYRGYAFLSEYDGHWMFVWPIGEDPQKNPSDSDFHYEESHYQLYQRYSSHVVHARGEFFFDVYDLTADTVNYEYIAPPYLLALEKNIDSVMWCKGEYLTPEDIASSFSVSRNTLPKKTGIGAIQPFPTPFTDQALILLTVLIILVTGFLQLVMNNAAEDKVLFREDYDRNELKDQKLIVTPPFKLEGGTKSLEVLVEAPLVNDWFFSEFTLVNETDGTEYNFTKEVEYYSGYEDGTTWSEGSKTGEAFLSQIPPGKYHLNIYPEFGINNPSFSIQVKHDVPMFANFLITCLGLLLYPLIYFLRKRYREQKRWSDSDYSPYASE
jgi:hypothetical protein